MNREATLQNLFVRRDELIRDLLKTHKIETLSEIGNVQTCIDAIKAGYEDSVILENLQFVGPGIAVQS